MILYAINVNSGGGKVLLDELLINQKFGKITTLFLDQRYVFPKEIAQSSYNIYRVKPRLLSRWLAEVQLWKVSKRLKNEDILCFGNLPPALRLSTKTIVYLQNAFLLPSVRIPRDSLKTFCRYVYERNFFNFFIKNADEIWVQTNWMKRNLLKTKKPIFIRPFLPDFPKVDLSIVKRYDFITVSGNAKHKMLFELLVEWEKMPIDGPNLLIVTETPNSKISNLINSTKNKKIHFAFNASREDIFNYYQQSKILIATSRVESFCLPIYEALHFKLPIIATKSEFSMEIPQVTSHLDELSCESILKNYLAVKNV